MLQMQLQDNSSSNQTATCLRCLRVALSAHLLMSVSHDARVCNGVRAGHTDVEIRILENERHHPFSPEACKLIVEEWASALSPLNVSPDTVRSSPPLCRAVVMRQLFCILEQTAQQSLGRKLPAPEGKGLLIPVHIQMPASVARQ